MPKKYVSKFTLKDGTPVYVKDLEAHDDLNGVVKFRGVTTTYLSDGSSAFPITINGESYDQSNGDIVIYGNKEFIWNEQYFEWHEFGDTSDLGALASKDSASGTVLSFGTVSKPSIDVSPQRVTIKEINTVGSVTSGRAASCTLPDLEIEYDSVSEDLSLSFTPGAFTPNVPTTVTLPTTKDTSVVSGVTAELHEAPVYTGDQVQVIVS